MGSQLSKRQDSQQPEETGLLNWRKKSSWKVGVGGLAVPQLIPSLSLKGSKSSAE